MKGREERFILNPKDNIQEQVLERDGTRPESAAQGLKNKYCFILLVTITEGQYIF